MTDSAGITVRGNATAEEVAAVLAALQQRARTGPRDRYALWRATRLAAVKAALPR